MKLNSLKIENLRNITRAELDFSTNINIVTGDNGAGKTTLLEAIYLLARAKSFRPGHQRSPIQQGSDHLLLFAHTEDVGSNRHKIGFYRKASTTQVKIDNERVHQLSALARYLPTALITPQSHRLIEEGPEQRRRLLNWGVFHVEQHYKTIMANFMRALLQRNNALRTGARDMRVWESSFLIQATTVSKLQQIYMQRLQREIGSIANKVPFLEQLSIKFYPGWKINYTLEESLNDKRTRDLERGFTSVGPHRADVEFIIDDVSAKHVLSRGQQKILIAVVLIAQARLLEEHSGEKPIFLIDDLESELDPTSIDAVCKLLNEQMSQTFITSLNKQSLRKRPWIQKPEMFHVEHGEFTQ